MRTNTVPKNAPFQKLQIFDNHKLLNNELIQIDIFYHVLRLIKPKA